MERIWHLFHYCEDNDILIKKLQNNFALEHEQIEKIAKINLKEGYSNISLKALKNILPYLKEGKRESDAVILGGVRNAFGKKWALYTNDYEELKKDILKINHDKTNKEGDAIEKIKRYLIDNKYGFVENDIRFKKLYHHSQEVEKKQQLDKIGEIDNLRNPIVQQGVNEVKRVVNELMLHHGKFDQIRVELGRDLKNGKAKRQELTYKIAQNTAKNENAKQLLTEYGLRHGRENVQKVLLYNELQEKGVVPVCPYTNKTINISDVLGRGNKIQIEHIIPKSISLDDSFANKTLCDSKFNGLKGERTPFDFYQINKDVNLWGGAKSWEDIERRAFKVLPYPKAKRFVSQTKFDKNNFIERQLNDTRYISKKTAEILNQVCEDVRVMPGSLTAELRKLWGLNNILQPAFTIDIPNLQIDANKHIPHYVVFDKDKNPIASHRIYNSKPELLENETTLFGNTEKGVFKSKEQYIKFQIDTPNLLNGEYWAKLKLSDPRSIVRVFKEKPETTENEIVVRGKIEKDKFKHEGLNAINAVGKENGTYWAKLSIKDKTFKKPTKEDQPKKNGKQILLFGEVKEGVFSSYVYQCDANQEDGKYWLIIDIDFDNVLFDKAMNEKPLLKDRQIIIQGTTNDNDVFVSDMDSQHHFIMHEGRGKYYVLFDIISDVDDFYAVKTQEPKLEEGQTLIEGAVWVDKYTGEIKFDPKKNREDHRHHAIDALVIALTKESYFQELSKYNASVENKKRGNEYEKEQLKFVEPWNGFHTDAQKVVTGILISFKQNRNILTEVRKKIVKNGKTYLSKGMAVRGQLHETTFYGKNNLCNEYEVIQRVLISKLKFAPAKGQGASVYDIVDTNIKKLIILKIINKLEEILVKFDDIKIDFEELKELKKKYNREKIRKTYETILNIVKMENELKLLQKKTEIEKKQKEINRIKTSITDVIEGFLQQETFYLPNEGKRFKRLNKSDEGNDRTPVPIKKIRIKKILKNSEKVNQKIGQYVNPGNNHHIVIYKDENEELKDNITNFWNVVERVKQNDKIYKLPDINAGEAAPKEYVLTFQENDMFLLGLSDDEFKDNVENNSYLSNYLYRVQKISDGDYSFRHHLASKITNKNEEIRVTSMKKYQEINPIKVKINLQGKLQIEEDIFNQIKIAEDQIKNGQFIEEKDFVFDVETILANRK
jgi:CRISPR-associated endonuclease Csn1